MTVVGTRPEIIRLSATILRLDSTPGIEHILVHTGQNWDHQLNGIFFKELGLRIPDWQLGVSTTSLGATLGDIFRKSEEVLIQSQPDAFLVLGDTNSALSLVMARRLKIATYHMEAGNRCYDSNVPEETNRRLVDHTSDFNLAYTEHARRNLLGEGLHPRRVIVTGSPMREVISVYRERIDASVAVSELGLSAKEYFLVSAHREENVDNKARLSDLVNCLNSLADAWECPVVVSTHPRTRKRLSSLEGVHINPLVRFHPPFGYFDYCRLQADATCVLSDSGTIAEESTMLGFPAVTLRGSIERPEALDTGAITMVDLRPDAIVPGVEFAVLRGAQPDIPLDYQITNTSERVVNFILSTAAQHRQWSGLR